MQWLISGLPLREAYCRPEVAWLTMLANGLYFRKLMQCGQPQCYILSGTGGSAKAKYKEKRKRMKT
jgi:hypothetical protein